MGTNDVGALPRREGSGASEPMDGGHGGNHHAIGVLPDVGPADIAASAARSPRPVNQVLLGKPEVVRLAVVALLTEGHLLIEDVPGVGKTRLAKALARTVAGTVNRVQFTPDLMPSDVTGVSVYDRQNGTFEFRPGPVFANILVADEINRASPKTQSALLEAMEEQQVTSDGVTYPLERPFLVMATQNPVEMEGTYPLPEAQRDRFLARTAIGYPDRRAEVAMLAEQSAEDPLDDLQPVTDAATVRRLIERHLADPRRAGAAALHRRAGRARPGSCPTSGSARPRGPPCTWPGPPRPAPRWTAAASSSRTTSPGWPSRCCRTASCSPSRRTPPAGPRPTSSAACWRTVRVPRGTG